ncbi:MAG: hypothetical protein IPK74_13630 [Deltaproteobacteria bacterium]|nr:hypothetical protein [Deltaproteobacteria bacterium]
MFDHALTICAVCLGFALVRALRRMEAQGPGYAALVGAILALDVVAMLQASRFVGVLALGLATVAVAVPHVLEWLARWAFGRGRLRVAVGLCGVRAVLMPGAGLARQQEILRGLALLESDGVDRALGHFRGLAGDAEGGESMIIHEQIVSMLFYGQRWDEGIAHYEARFHPRYAALRPALALGLLRAYGESGRLDTAAGLLRALEEGPVGSDPAALGFVSQARLTFLAYAGAASSVESALTEARRRALGLSPASSALLKGIALGRAGHGEAAVAQLARVPDLAGAADDRIVEASRTTVARRGAPAVLAPELSRYADAVSRRLEAFLEAAPRLRRLGKRRVAPLLALGLLVVELVRLGIDRGGLGLLDLGALTRELWFSGSHGRVFVASFVAGEPLAASIAAAAVWIGGGMIERVLGSGRLLLVALGGASAGMWAAMLVPGASVPISGAALVAIAVATGGLMLLPRTRTPALTVAARRSLLLPLAIVLLVETGGAYLEVFALAVPLVGVWVAAITGVVLVGLAPGNGPVARALAVVGFAMVAACAWGAAQVAREDAESFLVARRRSITDDDGSLRLSSNLVETEGLRRAGLPLPLAAGHIDRLAARAGDLVVLQRGAAADETPLPITLDPSLRRELDAIATTVPPAFVRRFVTDGGREDQLRGWLLRRDGDDVALVVERRLEGARAVAWVAAPPAALTRATRLYASVLADAR